MIEYCGCNRCIAAKIKSNATVQFEGPSIPGWRYACEICGNKRCPHHTDHTLACTDSNESGQAGSDWR